MNEEMRPVVGYEGIYSVTRQGSVYSHIRDRFMSIQIEDDGYLRVNLSKKGKARKLMVHRLVAEAFIPNPNDKPVVNHKDGDKSNSHIDNLEWVTVSENAIHAFKTGLSYISAKCREKASQNAAINGAKTTSVQVEQFDLKGNLITVHPSIREAERRTKANRSNIHLVCTGKRKTAGGFIWRWSE